MNKVKCRISTVSKVIDDTLLIEIEANENFGINDFYELKKAAQRLGEGKSFYNIINVGEYTLPDKEAREASSSVEGSTYKKADAFVINTLPQKIVGNLMLRVNKPIVPTKFFNSVQEAEKWIEKLKIRARIVAF